MPDDVQPHETGLIPDAETSIAAAKDRLANAKARLDKPGLGVQHLHAEHVEGCYRCELSRDEVMKETDG